ncbi:hypothetical protein K432DRAFT_256801, partial [Lepidopterella palustris CBS 459.81]
RSGERILRKRKLSVTRSGYFVIGPGILEDGDSLCVLPRPDLLFILREKAKWRHASDEYVLIGECYVHGLMIGQII